MSNERGDNELRDLISEIEQPFLALRTKATEVADQLYVHTGYKNAIVENLAPEITNVIPMPSRRPSTAAWQLEGIQRQSLSFHVEPAQPTKTDSGNPTQAGRRADKIELYYAHEWDDFNAGGRLLQYTYRDQVVGPFCAWQMGYEGFALPKEDSEREAYRKGYKPFSLARVSPLTVSFFEDDNGKPTISARHYEIPLVDLVKRYGEKGKDKSPLTILNEQFPMFRGGRGQTADATAMYREKAKVWEVDDGVTCRHYIDVTGKEGAGDQTYKQVGMDYPNPWGRPGILIITGRYNVDAELLEDRYEGLIVDLLREQRNVDVLRSHMASIAMTSKMHGQVLPEDVARAEADRVAAGEAPMPQIQYDGKGLANLVGGPADIGTELPDSVKDLVQLALADRDAALPSPFLTNPDQVTIEHATAAGQLNAHETSNRSYDNARESVIAGVHDVCKMIEHFVCEDLNKKDNPAAAKEVLHVRWTGKEPSRLYAGSYKGQEADIGPDDFDPDDVLEIDPVASTPSQEALEFQIMLEKVNAGVATPEDLIGVFTEDVSGAIERLDEWRRFQSFAPISDKLDALAAIETIRLQYGRDYSQIALAAGIIDAAPGEAAPMGPQPGDMGGGGITTQTTAPPPTAISPTGVSG